MADTGLQSSILPVDPREGRKETEIGFLPKEWKVVRLGGVVDLVRGISWGKADESPDGTPVVAIPNTHGGRVDFNIRYRIGKNISSQKRLYEGNILLVGSSGSVHNVGRTAVVKNMPFTEATFASFLVKAEPSEEMDHGFLYFLLASKAVDFSSCSKRAADGKYNLQVQALRDHMVPLPLLSEQKVIAQVLGTVQKAIESTNKVIEASRELKRSLMNHLFTYGPVPVDEAEQVPLKETPYGSVPGYWEEVDLEDCALVQTGVTKGRKLKAEETVEVPYLRVANVQDGYLDLQEIKTIRIRQSEVLRYKLRKGDVLLTEGGDFDKLGRGFVWNEQIPDCIHQNHVFAVRVDGTLLSPEYLAYLAQSRYGKSYFLQVAHRTTNLASINSTKLKAFPVLIPPPGEQDEIVRLLGTVDAKISVEENRKRSLKVLFETLLHNLMTGRVRVNNVDFSAVEEMV